MVGPGADSFGAEERAEVLEVIEGGHLSRYGDLRNPSFTHKVQDLEVAFAEKIGTTRAVAVNSGTSALFLSLLALGVGPGDEVLVPGFTYIATYSAVLFAGATPVLVEIDDSLTMDPIDLERKINKRSRAIIAVHMLGNPCDMTAIHRVATRHDLRVVEDVCQAAGATYGGRRLGTFGDCAAFSFNRYKILSAGEGGMITTSDDYLYERVFALHDQGHIPRLPFKEQSEHSLIGLNLKMTELTGAVALAQLRKLDRMLEALRQRKHSLLSLIPDIPGVSRRRLNDQEGECATFLTYIFDDAGRARSAAGVLGISTLAETGWHNYRHMHQIARNQSHRTGWTRQAKFAQPGDLPATDSYLARSINVSVGVTDQGLGSGFGINIRSEHADVVAVADRLVHAVGATSRQATSSSR